jgi:hypothetical protein
MSATLLLKAWTFSKERNLLVTEPYLAYDACLCCSRALLLTDPSVLWNNGELAVVTHSKALNVTGDIVQHIEREPGTKLKRMLQRALNPYGPLWAIKGRWKRVFWLSDLDSNQDKGLQRALCYRYTIGQPAQAYAFGQSVQNVFGNRFRARSLFFAWTLNAAWRAGNKIFGGLLAILLAIPLRSSHCHRLLPPVPSSI